MAGRFVLGRRVRPCAAGMSCVPGQARVSRPGGPLPSAGVAELGAAMAARSRARARAAAAGPADPTFRTTPDGDRVAGQSHAGRARDAAGVLRRGVHGARPGGPGPTGCWSGFRECSGQPDDPEPSSRGIGWWRYPARRPGLRLTRTGLVLESLIPSSGAEGHHRRGVSGVAVARAEVRGARARARARGGSGWADVRDARRLGSGR